MIPLIHKGVSKLCFIEEDMALICVMLPIPRLANTQHKANAFAENPPKERILNITPTDSIDLLEICDIINEIAPCKVETLKDGLNNEYTGDNAVLLRELPALRFTPYKQAIKEFYDFLNTEDKTNENK